MTKSDPKKQSIYKYSIRLDIEQDAWNWYNGCNEIANGLDWKQLESKEVVKNISGKTNEEAFVFLIPYLKQRYIDEKKEIDENLSFLNKEFKKKFNKACQKIVDLLGKPLYRNDFYIDLTTFPRCPLNYEGGYLMICTGSVDPIAMFLHELIHFQFIHYWAKNPTSAVNKLNNEQFEWLKESLTVILDEDFYPIIQEPDQGYKLHKKFRQELHKFWKANKDFDKLVEFGLKRLPHFVLNAK